MIVKTFKKGPTILIGDYEENPPLLPPIFSNSILGGVSSPKSRKRGSLSTKTPANEAMSQTPADWTSIHTSDEELQDTVPEIFSEPETPSSNIFRIKARPMRRSSSTENLKVPMDKSPIRRYNTHGATAKSATTNVFM